MSGFKKLQTEIEKYGDRLVSMYEIEELLRKSDFGRLNPERAHELARQAVGIPDDVSLGKTPLTEVADDEDL